MTAFNNVRFHFNTEFRSNRRFCFCALHAQMRLTEGLTKVLYQKAIDRNRTGDLGKLFETHLGMRGCFRQVQGQDNKTTWKPFSVKGYECFPFSKLVPASGAFPEESAIERVVRELSALPSRSPAAAPGPAPTTAAARKAPAARKTAAGPGKRQTGLGAVSAPAEAEVRAPDLEPDAKAAAQKESRFVHLMCHLWRKFHVVTKQLRCKDPKDKTLRQFGEKCRDLGARWCMFLPRNRCNSLYLHTVMMHGGAFMTYLLDRNLTIGMLENSGAERRHQIGKVQFRKSLGGGGSLYFELTGTENRTAYLTLRGLLIWQYGRDFLAYFLAEERENSDAVQKHKPRRRGLLWTCVQIDSATLGGEMESHTIKLEKVRTSFAEINRNPMQDMSDQHTDALLERLETAEDDSEPVDLVDSLGLHINSAGNQQDPKGFVNPDHPIVLADGRFLADLDAGIHDDSDGEPGRQRDGSESGFGSSHSDTYWSCSEDDGGSDADSLDEDQL